MSDPAASAVSRQYHLAGHARRAKGGYTRQRRGCLTCRQRKKKCDQVFPLCGHCSRLNLVCNREEPRKLPKPEAWSEDSVEDVSPAYPTSPAQSNGQSVVALAPPICESLDFLPTVALAGGKDLSASRRSMMRYYTSTLANLLSATSKNNCFLSVLLPMAFECPTLLDAMSAWSSAHLALHYPSFRATSLQHRGRVLTNFSAAIQDSRLSGDMCLAVSMTMCSMETISEATTSSWAHHLAGAAAALQANYTREEPPAVPSGEQWRSSFEGRWLLRNFAYHDALTSVSLDRRPLLAGDYWTSADDAVADPYCGLASRVIFLISETSILNSDWADRSRAQDSKFWAPEVGESLAQPASPAGMDGNADIFVQKALDIALRLRKWECPPESSARMPIALLSETYRSAALIYLGRIVERHSPEHFAEVLPEGIATHVASVCQAALKVPEGSNEECSLLFPLFMAGGEAETAVHKQAIYKRLLSMNKSRGFRNVDACRDVLDDVWRRRSEGAMGRKARKVDWRDVVEHRGWQLALS